MHDDSIKCLVNCVCLLLFKRPGILSSQSKHICTDITAPGLLIDRARVKGNEQKTVGASPVIDKVDRQA